MCTHKALHSYAQAHIYHLLKTWEQIVSMLCSLTKEEYTIPFGACVWSTGVAMHPLLKQVPAELQTELCACQPAGCKDGVAMHLTEASDDSSNLQIV